MKCTRCGSQIPTGSYYCDCCGKQIELEARYAGALAMKVSPGGKKPGPGYLYAKAGTLKGLTRPEDEKPGAIGLILRKIGAFLLQMTATQAFLATVLALLIEYAISRNILNKAWVYLDFSLPGIINMIISRFLPLERTVPFYFMAKSYLTATGIDLFLWYVLDIVKFVPVVVILTAGWRMFKKAGVPGKYFLYPVYNIYQITKIATGSGKFFWVMLGLSALSLLGLRSGSEASLGGMIMMLFIGYTFIMGRLSKNFGMGRAPGIVIALVPLFAVTFLVERVDGVGFAGLMFLPEILIFIIGFGRMKYLGPEASAGKAKPRLGTGKTTKKPWAGTPPTLTRGIIPPSSSEKAATAGPVPGSTTASAGAGTGQTPAGAGTAQTAVPAAPGQETVEVVDYVPPLPDTPEIKTREDK